MSREKSRVTASIGLFVIAAVMSTAAVMHLRAANAAPAPLSPPTITPISHAYNLRSSGHWMGRRGAEIVIVEFADFQCPFCAQMVAVLDSVVTAHPDSVAVVFRYLPLVDIHGNALGAAVAAECASRQGSFESFYKAAYLHQRDFGRRSWRFFASEARVRDLDMFASCLADSTAIQPVRRDMALAESLGLTGTPVMIIGGVRVIGSTSFKTLDSLAVRSLGER